MRKEKSFQADNFFSQLCDSGSKRIILRTKDLDLLLQVCKPLLLTLATFKCSNPEKC